ncbi:Zn-dependent exopeptidase, partial [Conidiobolus coronatus NRRL 28638]
NYKEGEDWFANFHTYESIRDWFISHSKKHPSHVKFIPSIGKSLHNNDIFAVHLSNNNTLPNGKTKSKIWFQSLIHAREWLGGSTTQYIFNELLKNHDTNPAVKKILDENEIIFIPVVNPDGYIFTRLYRFWRKNKNLTGVDINRNFPYRWGGPGASTNPIQDDYRGPGPASELETQAIISYFKKQGKILGAIDFHTFSQLVLRPQGDTLDDAPHEKNLKELGDGIRDVIKQSRGTEYISEKSYELYPTSGTAMDWFYGDGKTYGYTIELSP